LVGSTLINVIMYQVDILAAFAISEHFWNYIILYVGSFVDISETVLSSKVSVTHTS